MLSTMSARILFHYLHLNRLKKPSSGTALETASIIKGKIGIINIGISDRFFPSLRWANINNLPLL